MDLKCFSAPRAAKQQQQQQLAEVRALEPLLSRPPAPPAFAQFLSPRGRSATNALCRSSRKRSVTCSETESTQGTRQAKRRRAAPRCRSGGRGAGSVPALGGVGGAAEPRPVGRRQVLLLLPGGAHGQDGLAVLVLHHLQRDRRVPALLLCAPKVDLLPLGHHHREVHVLALPLHAVHRLHVGEVKLLDLGRRLGRRRRLLLLRRRRGVLGRDEEQPLLGEDTALLLPELQQPVAPLLQHALLHRLTAALQHPSGRVRRPPPAGAGLGVQAAPAEHSPPGAGSEAEGRERPGPQEAERLPPVPRRGERRALPVRVAGVVGGLFPPLPLLNAPLPPQSDTQRKQRLLPPAGRGEAQRGESSGAGGAAGPPAGRGGTGRGPRSPRQRARPGSPPRARGYGTARPRREGVPRRS